ncbi:MAG: hypothetical protein IJF98_08340 [Firmicutes bacterium]|nr:hypothetical protein [Bacillota bacterium]
MYPLSGLCPDTLLKEHLKNPVLVTENEAPLRSRKTFSPMSSQTQSAFGSI